MPAGTVAPVSAAPTTYPRTARDGPVAAGPFASTMPTLVSDPVTWVTPLARIPGARNTPNIAHALVQPAQNASTVAAVSTMGAGSGEPSSV